MLVPLRRRGFALVTVIAGLAAAGCSDDEPESETPPIGAISDTPSSEMLLNAQDVVIFEGFEGAEERDLEEAPTFENPDPRGPCGARVNPPSLDTATGRVLTGTTIGLTQYLTATTADQQAYVTELRADEGPPCEDYDARTNTGGTQTVSDITVFDLSGEGVRGVGWTGLIEVDGEFIYAGSLAIEADGSTTYIRVQSVSSIPPEGMDILADRAVIRIRGEEP